MGSQGKGGTGSRCQNCRAEGSPCKKEEGGSCRDAETVLRQTGDDAQGSTCGLCSPRGCGHHERDEQVWRWILLGQEEWFLPLWWRWPYRQGCRSEEEDCRVECSKARQKDLNRTHATVHMPEPY